MIASRVLKLRSSSGDIEIPICIFSPEEDKKGSWSCRYEIHWPDGKRTMNAGGVDSLQAILNAFLMIGSEIYTSNFHKSGNLYFEPSRQGYGIPVPATLRDLLVGDDARFL